MMGKKWFAKKKKGELTIGGCKFYYVKENRIFYDDYSFKMNGQSCTADYFKKVLIKELYENVSIYLDEQNRTVLCIHESIPIFDSGDRQWNSYKEIYLFRENGILTGIYLTGGYHLAAVKKFIKMETTDEKTKQMLDVLGI